MPGGAVRSISGNLQERIVSIASNLDMAELNRVFENYSIYRDHKPQAGRPVRDKLAAIAEQSLALRVELETMSEEAQDALWDAIGIGYDVAFHQMMVAGLSRLSGASRAAHNSIDIVEGNRRSTKQAFVRSVAQVLSSANIEVNTKPNGALCQIVGLLLTDFRDCPSDVAALLRNAMRDN